MIIKTFNNLFQILLKDLIKRLRDNFIKTKGNLLKYQRNMSNYRKF